MKKLNRIASFILAMVMILALGVTAFAAETPSTGQITIENPVAGQTYTAYRIFDLESYSGNAYSYKVNATWEQWARSQTQYVSVDEQGYVTWVKNADVTEFAKLALTHAKTAKLPHDKQQDAGSAALVFDNLPLGYYLIDSSLGALCSLDTNHDQVVMQEKNKIPTIEKQVEEDSNKQWGKENDADIGQTVSFKTVIHATVGAENYVVHDILSDGLTLNPDSIQIENLTKGTDYTVNFDQNCTDQNGTPSVCDFEVVFKDSYLKTITADTDIVLTYSATLNENAAISPDMNTNNTRLTYGDKNSTTWDQTVTKTYRFQLVKTDSTNKLLNGAQFELYDAAEGGKKIELVKSGNTYRIATDTEKAQTGFTSAIIEAGQVTIQGLDGNTTYYLQETKAPDGYNKLSGRVKVELLSANLDATVTDTIWKEGGVHVVNNTGTELPQTGGMGTTIFYVLGGTMVVAAVILLITKKRMHRNK